MIRAFTAVTAEMDDCGQAVDEILSGLLLEGRLLKNSVGVIACHREFVKEGIAQRLAGALAMETAGITTSGLMVNGGLEHMALGVTVLTSDSVAFRALASDSVREGGMKGLEQSLGDLYARSTIGADTRPSLAIMFAPPIGELCGDDFIEAIDGISGGVPLFGAIPLDFGEWSKEPRVICNGRASADSVAVISVFGDIKPCFSVTSISESAVLKRKGVITGAERDVIKYVNGKSALGYMLEAGIFKEQDISGGRIAGSETVLVMVYPMGGTEPLVRNIVGVTEEGFLRCSGRVVEDATIGIGVIGYKDVIHTSGGAMAEMAARGKNCLLAFSCSGRSLALDLDTGAEAKAVSNAVNGALPYMFAYSGGGICPQPDGAGGFKNAYNNSSLVAMTL